MITKYSVRQQITIHLRKSVWSSGRSSENFILWTALKRITSSSLVFIELVFIVTVSWKRKVRFWKRIRNQMRQGGLTLPTGQAWRILLRQTAGSSLGLVETWQYFGKAPKHKADHHHLDHHDHHQLHNPHHHHENTFTCNITT